MSNLIQTIKNSHRFRQIEKECDDYHKRAIFEDRYYILGSPSTKALFQKLRQENNYNVAEYFYDLYKECDDDTTISLKLGEQLEYLISILHLRLGYLPLDVAPSYKGDVPILEGDLCLDSSSINKIFTFNHITEAMQIIKSQPIGIMFIVGHEGLSKKQFIENVFDGDTYNISAEHLVGYVTTMNDRIGIMTKEQLIKPKQKIKQL